MNAISIGTPARLKSILARYGTAVLVTAASFAVRDVFSPWFAGRSVFIAFVLAVSISAAIGGLGPGALSTLIISIYGIIFVTRQAADAGPGARPDYAVVALFAFIGLMISSLGEAWYRARIRAGRDEEALEDSEQRFRLLIEHVVDYAIFLLNPDGKVTSWNPGAERITGYSEAEILGRHFSLLHPPDDPAAGDPEEALRRAAEDGRHFEEGWRLRKNGTRFWASSVLTPLRDRGGRIAGYAKVMRDLTEQRKAEKIVLAKQAELESINQRLTRAMMETHHRVRNSLQVISAMVDIRLRESRDFIPRDEVVRINRSVLTLAEVHALLTSGARGQDDAASFSARMLLEKLLPLMQSTADQCRIKFHIDEIRLPIRLATSLAILTNELVSNAIKHCREEIQVVLRVSDQRVELTVTDDGPGFPTGFSVSEHGQIGLDLAQNLAVYDFGGELKFSNVSDRGGVVSAIFRRDYLDQLMLEA